MEDIKPCPFCGAPGVLGGDHSMWTIGCANDWSHDRGTHATVYVMAKTVQEAKKLWNTRINKSNDEGK